MFCKIFDRRNDVFQISLHVFDNTSQNVYLFWNLDILLNNNVVRTWVYYDEMAMKNWVFHSFQHFRYERKFEINCKLEFFEF